MTGRKKPVLQRVHPITEICRYQYILLKLPVILHSECNERKLLTVSTKKRYFFASLVGGKLMSFAEHEKNQTVKVQVLGNFLDIAGKSVL